MCAASDAHGVKNSGKTLRIAPRQQNKRQKDLCCMYQHLVTKESTIMFAPSFFNKDR